eukprot:TRINITY_DN4268_c1_g1_i3.p1 TRINITY_DN4268_c1_g1~~TRINITY_DN4268_c1_g1_i3.p1  ORF type:complete len:585 (+),score=114.63 TRINITY_DN4268_c1_g1_i3:66-1757(+)
MAPPPHVKAERTKVVNDDDSLKRKSATSGGNVLMNSRLAALVRRGPTGAAKGELGIKREFGLGLCKQERGKVKVELSARSLKADLGVFKKEETSDRSLKTELGAHKNKLKTEQSMKLDGHAKAKPETSAKSEGGVKAEMGLGATGVGASLLQRGLQLRRLAETAKNQGVKREGKFSTKAKVKKEKRVKKRRGTVKRRTASRKAMNRDVALTPQLADLLGAPALSRPEAVKRVWAHCRERGMLNPEDKRQIEFTPELQELFGTPTARMTDLMGVLNPHFDYTATVPKQEVGRAKGERGAKSEVVGRLKHERRGTKREATSVGIKGESDGRKRTKAELLGIKAEFDKAKLEKNARAKLQEMAQAELQRAKLKGEVPAKFELKKEEVKKVEMKADEMKRNHSDSSVGKSPLRFRGLKAGGGNCIDNVSSGVNKAIDLDDAEISGLDLDGVSEVVNVDTDVGFTKTPGGVVYVHGTPSSEAKAEAKPAHPCQNAARWSPKETSSWCESQQLPELAQKVSEYGIDGGTLMSLEDEDLCVMGVKEPQLRHRLVSALAELRRNSGGGGAG